MLPLCRLSGSISSRAPLLCRISGQLMTAVKTCLNGTSILRLIISCTLLILSAVPAQTPSSHSGKNLKRGIRSGMGLYGLCWTDVIHSSCGRSCLKRTRSTIYGFKFLNSVLPQLFFRILGAGESSLIANALFNAVQFLHSLSDEGC